MNVQRLNGRQARWAMSLAAYDFEVKHRSGKTNPADGPSRRPLNAGEEPGADNGDLMPSLRQKLGLEEGNRKEELF